MLTFRDPFATDCDDVRGWCRAELRRHSQRGRPLRRDPDDLMAAGAEHVRRARNAAARHVRNRLQYSDAMGEQESPASYPCAALLAGMASAFVTNAKRPRTTCNTSRSSGTTKPWPSPPATPSFGSDRRRSGRGKHRDRPAAGSPSCHADERTRRNVAGTSAGLTPALKHLAGRW